MGDTWSYSRHESSAVVYGEIVFHDTISAGRGAERKEFGERSRQLCRRLKRRQSTGNTELSPRSRTGRRAEHAHVRLKPSLAYSAVMHCFFKSI